MRELINFLYNWQQLTGALVGALIAVGGSVGVNNYLAKRAERKKQYSNLVIVLYDIAQFISKCENYLNSRDNNMVSFDIIINTKRDYISSSQVFDIKPDVYRSIQKIYDIISMLRYNFEHSEAITTSIVKKNNVGVNSPIHIRLLSDLTKNNVKTGDVEIHTEENVISGRYERTLNLMRYYLSDVYRQFNLIYKEVWGLSKKYKYPFPETIKLYKKDYVEQKIKEYGLNKVI